MSDWNTNLGLYSAMSSCKNHSLFKTTVLHRSNALRWNASVDAGALSVHKSINHRVCWVAAFGQPNETRISTTFHHCIFIRLACVLNHSKRVLDI